MAAAGGLAGDASSLGLEGDTGLEDAARGVLGERTRDSLVETLEDDDVGVEGGTRSLDASSAFCIGPLSKRSPRLMLVGDFREREGGLC